MIGRMKPALLLCAAIVAGCGTGQSVSGTKGAIAGVVGKIAAPFTGGGRAEPPAPVSREMIAQLRDNNGVILDIPAFNARVPAVPVAVNGSKVTRMGGSLSVTTQGGGFLIATSGTPEDLLSSEVEGFGAALATNGSYSRVMEWPSRRDETRRATFTCSIQNTGIVPVSVANRSRNATLYIDTCTGAEGQFSNKYWVDSDKKLVKTQQWVSQTVGYLQIEHIS